MAKKKKSDLNLLALLVVGAVKVAWKYPKHTFLLACFLVFWQLLGTMFNVGFAAAAMVAAFVAAAYLALTLGFRVNQITGTGQLVPSLSAFVKYFWGEKTQSSDLQEKWERGSTGQGLVWNGETARLLRPHYVAYGDVVAKIRPGHLGGDVDAFKRKERQLAGALGCQELAILETGPGQADVHMYFRKPLDRVYSIQELVMPEEDDEICFAIDRDGQPTSIKMMSTLIGGETGAGKSGVLWAMLGDLVRRKVPTVLWVCDPKGGMEFDNLKRQLDRSEGTMTVRRFATVEADCLRVITEFKNTMKTRQARNTTLQRRKIEQPTAEEPLHILIIDEFLSLPKVCSGGASSDLGVIASQSRATLMMAIGLAQGGKLNMMGDVRDLFPQAICLRVKNRHVTEAFLSISEKETGVYCSRIAPDKEGTGWYRNRRGELVKFRAPFVTDDMADLIARSRTPQGMITVRGRTAEHVGLYRAYDITDRLLYIGISNNPDRREGEHIREDVVELCPLCGDTDCHWWAKHVYRFEVEKDFYPNETLAKQAEERAIKREKPLFNKVHNGDNSWHRSVAAVAYRAAAQRRAAAQKQAAARPPAKRSWWSWRPKPKAAAQPKPVKAKPQQAVRAAPAVPPPPMIDASYHGAE